MSILDEKFEAINQKLDEVLKLHRSLPEWYPLTKEYANECGYKTIDGLRKWCYNNLPPDDFIKKGKLWYIHKKSLPLVGQKAS